MKRALHGEMLGFCTQITSFGVFYRGAMAKGQKSVLAGLEPWSLGDQSKEKSDTVYSPKFSMLHSRDTGYPAELWCVA